MNGILIRSFAIAEKAGVPQVALYIFSVNSTLKGTSLGILSRLQFRGKALGYWQELLTPTGRMAPKVETRCVNQILSGRLISRAIGCSVIWLRLEPS